MDPLTNQFLESLTNSSCEPHQETGEAKVKRIKITEADEERGCLKSPSHTGYYEIIHNNMK